MSLFFLLNNIHFSLEILGGLVFLVVAWLAFDAMLIRRDFLTFARLTGFTALAVSQVLHAVGSASFLPAVAGYGIAIFGLGMVLANLLLERPVVRPSFQAVLVLPGLASIAPIAHAMAAGLGGIIAWLAYSQYRYELKAALRDFWLGFGLLTLGWMLAVWYRTDGYGALWMTGHAFELAGFAYLIRWVWQYLQLRIREEMILIFTSMSLLVAVAVTLVFSVILVSQIGRGTEQNLLTNARVLELAVVRHREEALAKAKFIAVRGDLATALAADDFAKLEQAAVGYLESERLGFLSVTDGDGTVVLRAHALTQRGEELAGDAVVASALRGDASAAIGPSPEGTFSVRGAAPLLARGTVIGAVVVGFPLDSAFLDGIKRLTGLEMSVYDGDTRVASTEFLPGGSTRATAIRLVDNRVREAALGRGEAITVRTEILGRPYLAAYLPILGPDGTVVGMFSSGKPQQEVLDLAAATNRLTLITIAALLLVLALPIYLITRRLSRQAV